MSCHAEGVYVCMACMALMTTMVLRANPQDSYACGARCVLLSTLIHKALVYIRILDLTAWTGINERRLRRLLNCTQAGTHAKLDKNQRINCFIPLYRDE